MKKFKKRHKKYAVKKLNFKIKTTVQKQLKQREKKSDLRNKNDADTLKEDKKEFIQNNKLNLRFKTERHNVLSEETTKIALSSNDDKRMRSIDSIEIYAYPFCLHRGMGVLDISELIFCDL